MEKQIFFGSNLVIKEELTDDDSDDDHTIKQKMLNDGAMLKYSSESGHVLYSRKVIKHEPLDVTMNERTDDDRNDKNNTEERLSDDKLTEEELMIANGKLIKEEVLTRFAHFMDQSSDNKKIINASEITEPAGEVGYLSKEVSMDKQLISMDNIVIKEEVLDDDSVDVDDDTTKDQTPLNKNTLKYPHESGDALNVFYARTFIKHDSLDHESTDDDEVVSKNRSNTKERPFDEKLTEEELINANGKIIKEDELTRFSHFMDEPNDDKNILNNCEMTEQAGKIGDVAGSELDAPSTSENPVKRRPPKAVPKNKLTSQQTQSEPGEKFVCPQCNTSFSHKTNLSRHMAIHAGKTYKCDHCPGTYARKCYLRVHMRIHLGEKPYVCAECGLHLRSSCQLRAHLMIHTGEKPYSCTECSATFRHKYTLNTHMMIHTGEKPFVCAVCNGTFRRKRHLEMHMVSHTNEKPAVCGECGKRFRDNSRLRDHMKRHTGENAWNCDECGKKFSGRETLRTHILTLHDI